MYTIDTNGWLDPHLSQEWLLTNGFGSFAGSTILSCNTRRYHGLLCAATNPPVGRLMTVNRVAEVLIFDGDNEQPQELSINQFGQHLHPRGDRYLQKFEVDDVARWQYGVRDGVLIKELLLCWKKNTVAIRYKWKGPKVQLNVLPFVSQRDFHSLQRAGAMFYAKSEHRSVSVSDNVNSVHIKSDAGEFIFNPDWWYGHTYAVEQERGQDFAEDLYTPGRFSVQLEDGGSLTIVTSIDPNEAFDWSAELEKRSAEFAVDPTASPAVQQLLRAAKDFVVERKQPDGQPGQTIVAGYPWFADWGRDTMISLPGLLLVPKRFDEARQVLSVFARYVSDGMIPNRFDDYTSEPHYNTVDASLWFIHAAFEYLKASADQATFDSVLQPACQAIIEGYRNGTRFHIKMDPADSLITQGDPSTQLTWMDAKCNGVAFTPRQGKAVEINALWYHALRLLGENELADRVQRSFVDRFWISPFRGLADVVDGERKDTAIRPNQIFAVSLANSPLSREQQSAVVEVVRRELLTPAGLRTLSRADPNYHARYSGPQMQRDAAYHNGIVWPWLIGAFLDAYVTVNDRSADSIQQAKDWLRPLVKGMNDTACIGSISEIYEADPPQRPVGCCAQAWSIAEVLRLAVKLGM